MTSTSNTAPGVSQSSSHQNYNARQLIVPSAQVPWSVEVISTVPKVLVGRLSEYDTGAVTSDGPSWVCLGLSSEGKFFVYPQDAVAPPTAAAAAARRTTTATTTASTTDDRRSQNNDEDEDELLLLPPKYVGNLFHAKLKTDDHNIPCLVALERRDHQHVVQIYVVHPTSGQLFCKKMLPNQVRSNMALPFNAFTRIELQQQPLQEVITCLQVLQQGAGLLVVGTSVGRLWLVKCTVVPMTLQVTALEYDIPDHTSSSSSLSLLGRLFTPSKKKMRYEDRALSSLSPSVQAILPLPSTTISSSSSTSTTTTTATSSSSLTRFWMVTQGGVIVAFDPTSKNTTEEASSSSVPWYHASGVVGHLSDAFSPMSSPSSSFQVLQAAVDPTPLVCRAEGKQPQQTKVVAHFLVQTQGRLYWMTSTSLLTAPSSNNTMFQVIRVHWLNRFPDAVPIQVGGLVVAENRMAYAAVSPMATTNTHSSPGESSGSDGPILIMALDTKVLPLTTGTSNMSSSEEDDDDDDDDDQVAIYEVDLPMAQVPSLLPHSLTLDRVTHGCTLLAASGIGLRIRCLPPNTHGRQHHPTTTSGQHEQTKDVPNASANHNSNSNVQSSKTLTLTSHLRSAFWHAYKHYEGSGAAGAAAAMPPSLEQATVANLEVAVVNVGQQLQQQPGDSSSQNPLDWHLAYINFLQQGGLYRRLPNSTRYKLMGMGQEVTVFSHLLQQTNQQQDILTARLQPHGIAAWFLDIAQRHQFLSTLSSTSTKEQQHARVTWCAWLCLALKAAAAFRLERANSFYDIPAEPEPWIKATQLAAVAGTQYLWTSQAPLQTAMVDLLQFWKLSHISAIQQGMIEAIVQAVLQSHLDTCFTKADQEEYANVKTLAIPLLRNMVGRDDLAFALSIDHCYFEGLCKIAKDHEKQHDQRNFSLDAALFAKLQDCVDTTSGLAFGPFCLQWHTERGLYGHVLDYGYFGCPKSEDLHDLLKRDERLHPFRWIHAIRQGDYDAATVHLLSNANEPDVSLADLNRSLSLAKLSNMVAAHDTVAEQSVTEQRKQLIDNQQELIQAQLLLLGEKMDDIRVPLNITAVDPNAPFHLRSASELLTWTLEKFNEVKGQEERWDLCFLGLAICSAIDDTKSSGDGDDDVDETDKTLSAARVWAKTILLDAPLWLEWIHTQPDLTDPELIDLVMETTIFGKALQQCGKDASLKRIMYGPSLERNVLSLLKWDHVATTELQRLLQHVCRHARKSQQ